MFGFAADAGASAVARVSIAKGERDSRAVQATLAPVASSAVPLCVL